MDKLIIQQVAEDTQVFELALKGRLDVHSYLELKDYFVTLQETSPRSVVLDLSEIDYIGSSGWSVISVQASSLEKAGN